MLFKPKERIFEVGAASGPVVTIGDIREHTRVSSAAEDYIIAAYVAAATARVEAETQRLLGSRQCILRLPYLPAELTSVELPGGAVSSVASVVSDGVTVSPANYAVYGASPARLVPTVAWPVTVGEGLPVVITYTAGYVSSGGYGAMVPAPLKQAIMLLAAEMFERRSSGSIDQIYDTLVSAKYLMEPYKIRAVA